MKKLTKVLPLVALAIASIVAFSGCGKILEAFYPEATGTGGGGGQFGVTLKVNVKTSVANWGGTMIVRLESADSTIPAKQLSGNAYNPAGSDTATWVVSFDYIKEADYRVFAWLDANGNGAFDDAAEAAGGRDWFHLPYWNPDKQQQEDHPEFAVDLMAPAAEDVSKVTLDVYVDIASVAGWPLEVVTELKEVGQGLWFPDPVRVAPVVESDDATKGKFEVIYEYLPAGSYRMSAWVDRNGNRVWDTADEEGVNVSTEQGEMFPIPYYNPWESPEQAYAPVWAVYLYGSASDPTFSLSGPSSIDRMTPGGATMTVQPVSSMTLSSVQFRVVDQGYGGTYYNGVWDWVEAYDNNATDGNWFSFDMDFSMVSPGFLDPQWDLSENAIVQVQGTYAEGGSYQAEWWVGLVDSSSGGTYYDLYVYTSFEETAPWGYAYVYVVDSTDYSTITSNSAYLDGSGYYPFAFYGLYDPEGRDQIIQVYEYDQYWNYIGYYEKLLDGSVSGTRGYYLQDYGVFEQW